MKGLFFMLSPCASSFAHPVFAIASDGERGCTSCSPLVHPSLPSRTKRLQSSQPHAEGRALGQLELQLLADFQQTWRVWNKDVWALARDADAATLGNQPLAKEASHAASSRPPGQDRLEVLIIPVKAWESTISLSLLPCASPASNHNHNCSPFACLPGSLSFSSTWRMILCSASPPHLMSEPLLPNPFIPTTSALIPFSDLPLPSGP